MSDPEITAQRLLFAGHTPETVERTLTSLLNQAPEEARQTLARTMETLAEGAARMDVLAEMHLNYRQRAAVIECLAPALKKEGAPAFYFSTQRMLLRDQSMALDHIHRTRKEDGRDLSTPSEKVKEERANAQSREEGRWQHMGFCRDQGYYYLPGVGALQPALCLDAETVALRDAMRLRHLPKSPYEDRILADYYGATFAAEKDIDPESLPKQELSSDEFPRDPTQQPRFPSGHDEDQRSLLASLTAERIRSYSEAFQKAEMHLDAVDQAHGSFRPCPACHPRVSPPQWIDETPVMKKVSQWKGLFTNVVFAALLIALALSQFLAPLSASPVTVAASRGGASTSGRADGGVEGGRGGRVALLSDRREQFNGRHEPIDAAITDGRFFLANYGLYDT